MGVIRLTLWLFSCHFATYCPYGIRFSIERLAVGSDGNLLPSACEDMTDSSDCTLNHGAHANRSAHWQPKPPGREAKANATRSTVRLQDLNISNGKSLTAPAPSRKVNNSNAKLKKDPIVDFNPSQTRTDTSLPHLPDQSWDFVEFSLLTCAIVGCTIGLFCSCCWSNAQRQNSINDGPAGVLYPDQGFEWCNAEQLLYSVDTPCDLGFEPIPPAWTAETTRQVLTSNGIHAHVWSESQLAELSNQLSSGLVCLVRDSTGEIQVRVDIVQVVLTCPPDGLVLKVDNTTPDKSGLGEFGEQDPEGRMNRKETLWESTLRCLHEQVGIESSAVNFGSMSDVLEKDESSFDEVLGISTVTRRYVVHVSVTSSTRADLDQLGLGAQNLKAGRRAHKWVPLQSYEMPTSPMTGRPMRDFGTAILPWNVAAAESTLKMHGIIDPVESFGKTLEDLSCALSVGKLSLGVVNSEKKRLMCIMEEVSLMIASIDGQVFISPSSLRMLPTTVKWSNENVHMTAFRLLQQFFGIYAPLVEIDQQTVVTDNPATCKGHISRTILMFGKMSIPVSSLAPLDVTQQAMKPTSS